MQPTVRSSFLTALLASAVVMAACARDARMPTASPRPQSAAFEVAAVTCGVALPVSVFGPVTYTRDEGGPLNHTASFAAPAGDTVTLAFSSIATRGLNATVSVNDEVVFASTGDGRGLPATVVVVAGTTNIIDVTLAGKPGSSLTVAATRTGPAIGVSPTSTSFTAVAGGASPVAQGVSIMNCGTGTLTGLAVGPITYGDGQPTGWLSASLSSTTAPANLALAPTLGALPAGTYSATVPISSTANGITNSPQFETVTLNVAPAGPWRSVSAGPDHTCALTTGGAAYCWGTDDYGQLGDGHPAPWRTSPVAVAGGLTFTSLSAGGIRQTCGLTAGGTAYCWGDGEYGQLGNGATANNYTPGAVSGGLTFASISVGIVHTCALTTAGAAYCWGDNFAGELGNNSITSSSTPVAVSGGLTFATVTAGEAYTCGLTIGGAAYCWGDNESGQLGNGGLTGGAGFRKYLTPVPVSGGLTFASVSGGYFHTCGLTTGGAAYCWGTNDSGDLGIGGIYYDSLPQAVTGGLTFAAVSAGLSAHTCGLATGGAAYCWGDNTWGELGGSTVVIGGHLVGVDGGLTFASVSAGAGYTCAVTSGGAVYCWGANSVGQLGNGSTTNSGSPVAVPHP